MTIAKKWLFGAVTFLLTVLAALAGGELFARLFWRGGLPSDLSERILAYRYDANLGWFPLTNSETRVHGNHWTARGHEQVCLAVNDYLATNRFLTRSGVP